MHRANLSLLRFGAEQSNPGCGAERWSSAALAMAHRNARL
jgi:hypothetical protein